MSWLFAALPFAAARTHEATLHLHRMVDELRFLHALGSGGPQVNICIQQIVQRNSPGIVFLSPSLTTGAKLCWIQGHSYGRCAPARWRHAGGVIFEPHPHPPTFSLLGCSRSTQQKIQKAQHAQVEPPIRSTACSWRARAGGAGARPGGPSEAWRSRRGGLRFVSGSRRMEDVFLLVSSFFFESPEESVFWAAGLQVLSFRERRRLFSFRKTRGAMATRSLMLRKKVTTDSDANWRVFSWRPRSLFKKLTAKAEGPTVILS